MGLQRATGTPSVRDRIIENSHQLLVWGRHIDGLRDWRSVSVNLLGDCSGRLSDGDGAVCGDHAGQCQRAVPLELGSDECGFNGAPLELCRDAGFWVLRNWD